MRRPRPTANEVAIREHAQIGLRLDELIDRSRPKDAPDHRRRLERCLFRRAEQVDPRRKNRVDGIRHRELARKLAQHPGAVVASEQTAIDQHPEQLPDEEGTALGTLDDKVAKLGGQPASEQLVEHPKGVLRGEGLQLEQLTADAGAPARTALEKFGARGRESRAAARARWRNTYSSRSSSWASAQ
jgi:hypothetical protein